MNESKIGVIIINWNGKHLLEECLYSVKNQDYDNYKIIFVDNGSKDSSVEFVKEKFPEAEIISLNKNTGFAKANNIGIHKSFKDAEIEYIALLNNDAIAEKNWLSEMMKVIGRDRQIGSVAPKILQYYKRNIIDNIGIEIRPDGGCKGRHIDEKNSGQYNNISEIFGSGACACLYRRKMLEDIQMKDDFFDSDFFAYCEEIDLNWRAKLRNWKSFTAPKSLVYHKGSETFKTYSFAKAFYTHRNRLFVITKNFPFIFLIKGFLVFILSYFFYVKSILTKKGYTAETSKKIGKINMVNAIIKGWFSFFYLTPKMIKKRRIIQKRKLVDGKEILKWFQKINNDKNNKMNNYIKIFGVQTLSEVINLFLKNPLIFCKNVFKIFRPTRNDYRKIFNMTLGQWMIYHQKNIVFNKCYWMGAKAMKNPLDAWIYQEIIYSVKPDIIIEIGSANGGGTLYLAHLLDIIGQGKIISIDIDRTNYNIKHDRIITITGNSSSSEVVEKIFKLCQNKSVLIIHDGDHSEKHVLKDLQCYSNLVSIGSYFIVEDGIIDLFRPGNGMGTLIFSDGPLVAVEKFLSENNNFIVDKKCERYLITYNPKGFLKRIK